jgi:hypothetical protein
MAGDTKTTSGGLNFTYPAKGRASFSPLFDVLWAKVSSHDHSGSGKGVQIQNSGIADLTIRLGKLNMQNDEYLDALNNAGSGRVDVIKVNTDDLVEMGTATVMPHLRLTDGVTAPTSASGYALIYVDTADGDLKVRFGDGTTKTIATDT